MNPTRVLPLFGQVGRLVAVLVVAVLGIIAPMGYLIWSSYQEAIESAKTTSANYAATIEARLDATLRRTDGDLLELAHSLPVAALSKQAVAGYAGALDAKLDSRMFNFPEVVGLRAYDADGDLLYTTESKTTPRVNVADRDFFRQARDGAPDSLAISEVIIGRTIGRPTLVLARALRDEQGAFRGIVDAAIELEYFQKLFQSLEIGAHGAIGVFRSDNFDVVVRWPTRGVEFNRPLPPGTPVRVAVESGQNSAIVEFPGAIDSVRRIFSIHRLDNYPFFVTVGLAHEDVLAGWRMRSLAVGLSGLLLLLVLGTMLYRLWRDITARIAAEHELAATRDNLADAIESIQHSISLYDKDDRLVLFNQGVVGRHAELRDVIKAGVRFEDIIRAGIERGLIGVPPGQDAEKFIAERVARHRDPELNVITQRFADGRTYQFHAHRARNGGIISVGLDVTAALAAEDRLRDAQKMEAIGKLTGGMAHDFNNYLGIIIGNLDLLKEREVADAAATQLIDAALGGALRGAELTQSLLAFSRVQPLAPRRVDVGRSLDAVATLLKRTLGEDITLTTAFARDLWPVRIDSAQLDSCILNLANNARDAMPRGGTLTISTSNTELDAQYAQTHPEVVPGDYVLIEVSDTGVGMSPEILARVFEPFFTTKPAGHGTGLGLSMVYGFVKQSQGHVAIYSEVGHGTVVRLYLPRDRDAKDEAAAATEIRAAAPAGGTETILVVEDKELMRQTVVQQLASLGYRVIEAENGAAALAILARGEPPIDLLFTDIVMPGNLDGYELARRAMEQRPDIKVVLTSGFPGDALRRNGNHMAALRLLNKPYRMSDLERSIRAALDSASVTPDNSG